MLRIRQFASILLMAVLFGYPAMACITPNAEMTEAERECCKHMAQDCGSMEMPSSHTCCQKEVKRPNEMVGRTSVHLLHFAISETLAGLTVPKLAENQSASGPYTRSPESPPSTSSILRI